MSSEALALLASAVVDASMHTATSLALPREGYSHSLDATSSLVLGHFVLQYITRCLYLNCIWTNWIHLDSSSANKKQRERALTICCSRHRGRCYYTDPWLRVISEPVNQLPTFLQSAYVGRSYWPFSRVTYWISGSSRSRWRTLQRL